MNTETGQIVDLNSDRLAKEFIDAVSAFNPPWQEINPENLSDGMRQELKTTGFSKLGRNDPCGCGSGKKFKKCCLSK